MLRTETLNDELGGAETIVRNHVDRALMGLAGEELEAATDIFHDLVTPSGVKVAHTARDLAQMSAHSETTVGAVLDRLYEERIVRAVDPAPGSGQARYEIFHDRLAAPILDWRQQRENARLDRASERAEQEAEVQRTQARRFKRRARIMFALAVGLLVLLVAVAVLLGYARHQSDTASARATAALRAPPRRRTSGSQREPNRSSRPGPTSPCCCTSRPIGQSPQRAAERSLRGDAALRFSCRARVGILHGHTDAVESIAFSPDGSTWLLRAATRRSGCGRSARGGTTRWERRFGPTGRCTASRSIRPVRSSRLEAQRHHPVEHPPTRETGDDPRCPAARSRVSRSAGTATCSPPAVLMEPCSYGTR